MPKVRSFTVLPALPDDLRDLETIARNMFWCWNPEFVQLFQRIDKGLWDASNHNPVKLIGSVSQEKLEELAENKGFICELKRAAEKLKNYLESETWFDRNNPNQTKPQVAYFSAEFGFHESLPIYSGGLGILAGDHLKSASDLGIPLCGVGLLYQKGYFCQYLNIDGWQQEVYVENDFYNLPLELMQNEHGEPVIIGVEFPGRDVFAQIWKVEVGRVSLYLLDTNIPANSSEDRVITANLYGGDREMRIKQEVMLGIGGLRALYAIGVNPTVCHMNEGHAAFMGLERIRLMQHQKHISFDEALEATRVGNVFTTHTPVKAGNDEFPPDMIERYFERYYPQLGISKQQFMALGRVNANYENETFKMPVLALRLSAYKNGVSKLHGEVSRKMWSQVWPELPVDEVPISSVTNGVHVKSWLSEELSSLFDRYLGPNWADMMNEPAVWKSIDQIPDEEFWRNHQRSKLQLIAYCRNTLKTQMQRRGTYHTELNWAEEVLDPEALTIGFARRFATYKRGNLILRDAQRLIKILSNTDRPVQFIFAGKAHPRDNEGKEIIRQIIHFATQYDVRRRIVFLENYNMDIARHLVRGVDVWLNTPRPPMEASGTSGMKAAINGVLNFSTLDGWWCEGYKPEGGWIIGKGEEYEDPNYQDIIESQSIYNLLENEIIPLFYTRSSDNLPRAWISRIKKSLQWIVPRFNTRRMVTEYTEKFYNPAEANWQYLTSEQLSAAKALSSWKSQIKQSWSDLSIEDVKVEVRDGQTDLGDAKNARLKVGSEISVKARIRTGRISPDDIAVQLYYGSVDSWGNIENGSAVTMDTDQQSQDSEHWFNGSVKCKTSGRQGLAVRILPKHPDLVDMYEPGLILWESTAGKGVMA